VPFSALSHLTCPRCGRDYDAEALANTCACGSPLLARYDLGHGAASPAEIASRREDLWRYHELLPVRDAASIVSLGEAMTPLLPMSRLGARLHLRTLLMKDDGRLPTGSFKARGAAVGVSRAAELGARRLSMPTNGNAGAAWAAYAARAGLHIHVAMPLDAPRITRSEASAVGAELTLVRGHIGQAGQWLAARNAEHRGDDEPAFDVSTLREPYRIEGKKTMALEMAEQLGWRMPDVVVYPTGGGVGMIGMHKAFGEMRELGWVDGPLPRFVAVQSAGCAPIVQAFESGSAEAQAWPEPHTAAFGLNVPKPLGDFLILQALRETDGTAIAVDDRDLLADISLVGREEGVFVCPEGAATITAVRELRARGWLDADDLVVVLNTGTGLLYPETVEPTAREVTP
jgi:threonine synthase